MYDESADSNLGPFTVDARLTSIGGSVLYATGEGRVSCLFQRIQNKLLTLSQA